jgi:hypothetical protein
MGFNLSEEDHLLVDRFLDSVLERYRLGKIDLVSARSELAEAFDLLSQDGRNVLLYMRAALRHQDK